MCCNGIVYARKSAGKTLTFGVSGMLWEGNLVMVDQETESLWSQILGTAMRGPLVGESLETLPSSMTSWRSWKERHPETSVIVMERSSWLYSTDNLASGMFPGAGIALADDQNARIWQYDVLSDNPVINDRLGDLPVLVYFDPGEQTAVLYRRSAGEENLTFEFVDGQLTDKETGTVWNGLSGEAVSGKLAGERLARLPSVISDAAAWSVYHPHATLFKPFEMGTPP